MGLTNRQVQNIRKLGSDEEDMLNLNILSFYLVSMVSQVLTKKASKIENGMLTSISFNGLVGSENQERKNQKVSSL